MYIFLRQLQSDTLPTNTILKKLLSIVIPKLLTLYDKQIDELNLKIFHFLSKLCLKMIFINHEC